MKNTNNKSFLLFFVIFLTSFLLWFIVSLEVTKKSNKWMLKIQIEDEKIWVDDTLNLQKFWNVYGYIKGESYDIEEIKKEDLVDWAVKWLVDWLWDKFSEYFSKEENQRFNDNLSGDFEGIWAVVELHPLWVKIDRIIKWSPAKKFWLISWDILIEANEKELEWLTITEAVWFIKWKAWTEVDLKILRVWETGILEKKVIRDKIKIPSISSEDFWDIGYISINMFWENTSEEFNDELENFKEKEWLIIDLRDNWGWYLMSAVEILSNFIEPWKKLVITKDKSLFWNKSFSSFDYWELYEWKIVVLINENSASASEITAWALSDYNKAILVWKKSYWKGSVQKTYDLWDWSMVKLTVSKWFTPNDKNIDKEWIEADIEIDFEKQDYDLEECIKNWICEESTTIYDFKPYDRQLEEAKKVLNKFIELDAYQLTIEKLNEKIWE